MAEPMVLAGCGSCRCTGCAYCIREWFTNEACDCPDPDAEFGCKSCGCDGCADCAEYSFETCGCWSGDEPRPTLDTGRSDHEGSGRCPS